jgi:uncharacterized membrane protein
MEKLVVIVFDSELKAIEGFRALKALDRDGDISVNEAQVIKKGPTGAVRVVDTSDMLSFPLIGGGTVVGALVGLLGGPVGALVGATAGALVGSIGDAVQAGVTDEFISDIETALTPDKAAVIAEISEEWMTPLDEEMERIGGLVFRRVRTFEKATQDDSDAAAHKAEMDQLKAERAKAKSERLAKIDARIDKLRAKMENAIQRKRDKMRLHQQQREARIKALQAKADAADGDVRRRQEARIAELQRDYAEKAGVR